MVTSSNPWFYRGGGYNNTSNAGVFYYNNNTGGTNNNISFRVVHMTTKENGIFVESIHEEYEEKEDE